MASKSIGLLNVVFGANTKGFERAMKKAQAKLKKFGGAMKKVGRGMTTSLTAPLVAFAAVSVRNFDKQAKAEKKLLVALKDRGEVQQRLIAQAKELQTKTLFGDEETIAAQSMLATMGLEEDAITRLIPLVQDMAVAKGMGLVQAADLVAKSVGSSTNALSRYGIVIEGAVGSSGRLDSAVGALTTMFQGQAEAAAQVGAGSLIQLKNIWGDISEDFGRIIIPALNQVAAKLKEVAEWIDGLTDAQKVNIIKWLGIVAALGPALMIIGQMSIGIGALIPVFASLNAVMAANPIGAIITAIVALIAGLYWLLTSSSDTARLIRNAFIQMANGVIISINAIIKGLNLINPFEQIKLIKLFGYEAQKELEGVVNSAGDAANAIADVMEGGNTGGGTAVATGGGSSEVQQFSSIPDSVETDILFNMSPAEDQFKDLVTETGYTFKTIEEQATEAAVKMAEKFQEFGNKVKQVMGGIGDVISAANTKEQAEFDIWKESQTEKQDILDGDMERELERVEASNMSDEAKADAKIAIEEKYAEKKGAIDAKIESKEKDIKRKQAIRNKAMAIVSAVMSTAEAIMGAVAAFPVTGGLPMSAIVAGLGAAQIATIASTPIPFAKGGLVSGATLGLIGEGAGTSAFNPEVVSPLDKLQGMLGGGNVNVHGRIQGNNIVLVSDKATISRERFI